MTLLQLAAINEGLGTGFCSPARPQDLTAIARLAGFPAGTALAGVLTSGHSADGPAVPAEHLRKRCNLLDQLVRWRSGPQVSRHDA